MISLLLNRHHQRLNNNEMSEDSDNYDMDAASFEGSDIVEGVYIVDIVQKLTHAPQTINPVTLQRHSQMRTLISMIMTHSIPVKL